MSTPSATERSAAAADDDDLVELERALTRLSHLLTRVRRHDRAVAEAGVNIDRASVPLLRLLADGEPALRLGELAAELGVEAPAVTRQVQRLERAGLVERVADPDDRRAQRVRLTPAGRVAIDAIRTVGRRWMQEALAEWTPADLRALATLNHRMVDDFLAHAARVEESGS
jgi:DNA-binding MarR family transcriptional regulator